MTLRKSYRRTTCSRPRIRDSRNVGKDKREADGNHEKREIEDEEEKRDEPNGAPAPTEPGRGKKKKSRSGDMAVAHIERRDAGTHGDEADSHGRKGHPVTPTAGPTFAERKNERAPKKGKSASRHLDLES